MQQYSIPDEKQHAKLSEMLCVNTIAHTREEGRNVHNEINKEIIVISLTYINNNNNHKYHHRKHCTCLSTHTNKHNLYLKEGQSTQHRIKTYHSNSTIQGRNQLAEKVFRSSCSVQVCSIRNVHS